MKPQELRALTNREQILEARRADAVLADEVVRVRAADEQFKDALDYSLTVEAEQNRRQGRR